MLLGLQQNLLRGVIGLRGQAATASAGLLFKANSVISTLVDDFNDGSLGPLWTFGNADGLMSESAGKLRLYTGSGAAGTYAQVYSNAAYDLTGSQFVTRIDVGANDSSGIWSGGVRLRYANDSDAGPHFGPNYIEMYVSRSLFIDTLNIKVVDGGVTEYNTTLDVNSSPSYTPANVWWKISESGGTITFWTAPEVGGVPGTWTSRGTYSVASVGHTVRNYVASLFFYVESDLSDLAANEYVQFDTVNPTLSIDVNVPLTTQLIASQRGDVMAVQDVAVALTTQLITSSIKSVGSAPGLKTQLGAVFQGSLSGQQNITGSSTTAQIGSITSNPSAVLTGSQTNTQPGQLAESESLMLSGSPAVFGSGSTKAAPDVSLVTQLATTGIGSVAPIRTFSGAATASTQGIVTSTSDKTLSGLSAGVTAGSIVEDDSVLLTSQTITSQQGAAASNTDMARPLTGQQASVSAGSVALSLGIKTQALSFSQSKPTADSSTWINGTEATFAQQSVQKAATTSLSGLPLGASTGTLTDSETYLLNSVSATVAHGTVNASIEPILSGEQVSIEQGITSNKIILGGTVIEGSQGTSTPSVSVSLSGLIVLSQQSSLSKSIGLLSNAIVIEQGQLPATFTDVSSGVDAVASTGSVTSSAGVSLLGESTSIEQGTIAHVDDIFVGLIGKAASFAASVLDTDQWTSLSGITVLANPGSVGSSGGEAIQIVADTDGGYGNYGADIRTDLSTRYMKQKREEWMELAQQEDMLLLATIKSTLENPKYGF